MKVTVKIVQIVRSSLVGKNLFTQVRFRATVCKTDGCYNGEFCCSLLINITNKKCKLKDWGH